MQLSETPLTFDVLSPEQDFALRLFKNRENLFLTGAAGTGKSYLIKRMIYESHQKGMEIQVCALTGIAAVILNCKARTIHSCDSNSIC
jgi:ATP-dependent DNA helicase PIF1